MHKIVLSILTLLPVLSLFGQDDFYGKTLGQNAILNMECLHERGFTGEGIIIGHFDDGYDGFDTLEAFDHIREKGLLKGAYDFVHQGEMTFANQGSHGLQTVSVTHGYIPGTYIGTGYGASLLLAHTEDNRSEKHIEEVNWKKAVDWAIENEVDIITSSLQYNTFDRGEGDFTYQDLDGDKTLITRSADEAASRGVLVVAIQGNFGLDQWHYLAAPGDADSVLTVGAVNVKGKKAGFSSFGPSADGRIKPDVMAVGDQTYLVNPNGRITKGNGTSYAAPAIAGLAACLMQAHPERSNMEIISAIRQSGNRYFSPDKTKGYGYGIPDACLADSILSEMDFLVNNSNRILKKRKDQIEKTNGKIQYAVGKAKKRLRTVSIVDSVEKEYWSDNAKSGEIDLTNFPKGYYALKVFYKKSEAPLLFHFYVQ